MAVDPNEGIKKQDSVVKYNLTALQKANTVKRKWGGPDHGKIWAFFRHLHIHFT